MGVTGKSMEIMRPIIGQIKTVCELGAQNNYSVMSSPAPYMSEWWKARGIESMSIDLSGENDSKKWDLSEPLKTSKQFDMVTDFGTSEHVKDLYQCMVNVNKLTKVGGYMVHENPKTGNWPLHGYHYRTTDFYRELAKLNDYELIRIEEHPAMGNSFDGWNVIAVMKKTKEGFIDRDQFPKTYSK